MATTVSAIGARSVTWDSFADLTDVPVSAITTSMGIVTVTFDGDIDNATQTAVYARMVSRTEAERELRALLVATHDSNQAVIDDPASLPADVEWRAQVNAIIRLLTGYCTSQPTPPA